MLRRALPTLLSARHARWLASDAGSSSTSPPADKWKLVSVDRSGLVGGGEGGGGGDGASDGGPLPPGFEDTPLLKHIEALIKVGGM